MQPLSVAQIEKARVCCRMMWSCTQSRIYRGEPAGAVMSLACRADCARGSCSEARQPVRLASTQLQPFKSCSWQVIV